MLVHSERPPESEIVPATAHTDELTPYEKKLVRRFERKQKRRSRMVKMLAGTAIACNALSISYWNDVRENQELEASAEISINVINEEPLLEENSDKATIFIDGFNAFDADYLGGKLGEGMQHIADGEVWSLGYNNAILQRSDIYEKIVALATERGITKVTIVGYSMGGIIGAEAASDLITESEIDVESLIFISSPDGYDGLREYQRKELAFGQWVATFIAGSEYSTAVRKGGEVYFYRDRFTKGELGEWWNLVQNVPVIADNIPRFFETVGEIAERTSGPRQTTMRLLSQQVFKIARADINHEFERIVEHEGEKQMPVILYFGTDEPGYDYIVDDKTSSENICSYADESGLQCAIYNVPGAIHSQYYKTIDEYMRMFNTASEPTEEAIATEAARLEDAPPLFTTSNEIAVEADGTSGN